MKIPEGVNLKSSTSLPLHVAKVFTLRERIEKFCYAGKKRDKYSKSIK